MIVAAILLTICGIFAYWYYRFHYFTKYLKNVPGPKPWPIVGCGLEFSDSSKFLSVPLKMTQKYGGVVPVPMAFELLVFVTDYKMVEFFLGSMKHLEKAKVYTYLHNWLGTGLLTSWGEKWRKRRKMITPAYHFQILEQFVDVFEANGNILVEKLSKEVGKGSTDIYPYITLCALDNICESAMGTSVNAQKCTESVYVKSVKEMCRILAERAFSPYPQNSFTYRFTKHYRDEAKAVKVLHKYTMDVIASKRAALAANDVMDDQTNEFGSKKRVAFLDLLIKSTIDGKPLSDEDIREEVDTFMFEGHDTTASGIAFTLYCIATDPEVQSKVNEEQKSIFGDDPNRSPTHRELLDMRYLELVIKESLRLYPSVPLYARELQEDCKYSDDIIFRKGTQIGIVAYNIHRNPEIFPDPEKFDPERFADGSITSKYPYAYLPFSAGPRNCIGQKFAMLELKSIVSKVVRNFELSPVVPEHKMVLVGETILKSSNGILLQVKKRNW